MSDIMLGSSSLPPFSKGPASSDHARYLQQIGSPRSSSPLGGIELRLIFNQHGRLSHLNEGNGHLVDITYGLLAETPILSYAAKEEIGL